MNEGDQNLIQPTIEPYQSTSIITIILTFIKIILVIGILFFILFEINKQTNNSIIDFFNQLFKSSSTSSTTTSTPTTTNKSINWMSYINNKTNSFKKQFYKEPFSNMNLIEQSKYIVNQPQPDESTSNVQNKKAINQWTQYDNAYTGKLY